LARAHDDADERRGDQPAGDLGGPLADGLAEADAAASPRPPSVNSSIVGTRVSRNFNPITRCVGFVLALTLKQVPLRNNDVSTAANMGEGFAMPTTDSPDQLLENAVGRLIRQGSGTQLRAIAERPGSKLDIGRLWALLQVFRFGQAAGQARLGDIAEHVRVPREILEPAFDRLAATGYAERSGDAFWLTPAGAHQVEVVRVDTMDWLTRGLVQSAGLQVRPDRGQVREALDRITQDVLVQRDWTEDETQAMRMRLPRRAPQPIRSAPQLPRGAAQPPRPVPPSMPPRPDPRGRSRGPGPSEPPTTRLRPPGPPRGNPRPPHR
jgi:hypothetical protein